MGVKTKDRERGVKTKDREGGVKTKDREGGVKTKDREGGVKTKDREGGVKTQKKGSRGGWVMKTQKHLESTVRVKTQTSEIEVSRHKNKRQRGDVVKTLNPQGGGCQDTKTDGEGSKYKRQTG